MIFSNKILYFSLKFLVLFSVLQAESLDISEKKVLICGVVKNAATSFYKTTEDIQRIGKLFQKFHVIIFENDSIDETHSLYADWSRTSSNITFISESLNNYSKYLYKNFTGDLRTEIIAHARNKVLQEAYKEIYSDFDYLIMMDLDNFYPINENLIKFSIENPEAPWDAIFANGSYDLYALRSDEYPCGPEGLGFDNWHKLIPTIGYELVKQLEKNRWIKVDSAYGGLGIYKLSSIRGVYYSGFIDKNTVLMIDKYLVGGAFDSWGNLNSIVKRRKKEIIKNLFSEKIIKSHAFTCEHILFHLRLKEKGCDALYIDPRLIRNSLEHRNFFEEYLRKKFK